MRDYFDWMKNILLSYVEEDMKPDSTSFESMIFYNNLDIDQKMRLAVHFKRILLVNPTNDIYWWCFDRVIRERECYDKRLPYKETA